ncbi:MAG: adenylate/guanylate cyclase domain-containing protein [Acidimicrobiales bacterium]
MSQDEELGPKGPPPPGYHGPPTYAGPPDRERRMLDRVAGGASPLDLGGRPPDAGEMAQLLRAVGVGDADIASARAHGHLELLALEHLVVPEVADRDVTDVEAATGLSGAQISQLWRSLGFAEPRPGDRIFTDVDVDMLRTIGQLLDMGWIDDELTVQMARVIGSSLSRVASALVDSIDPAEPTPGRVDDDAFATAAPLLMPMLMQVMDYVWRRHVQAEARARMSREHAGADPDHRVVGFADLVGFTALSQQISAYELAGVVDRFESIAYDTVGRSGGRVVKMIGDEVMFSVPAEGAAVEIALSLAETYRDDDELSDVRVGLAAGPVLQREADLFGPVVNRASRIVNIAFPGSVVCSAELREALGDYVGVVWKSIGSRRLKDIGKVELYVTRRAGAPPRPKRAWQEHEEDRAERREARVGKLAARREGDDIDGGDA